MTSGPHAATQPPLVDLFCNTCRRVMTRAAGAATCPSCGLEYPVRDGIVSCTGSDEFYEHQCTHSTAGPLPDRMPWFLRLPAWIDFYCNELQRRQRFFWKAGCLLGWRQGTVLDFGCGGGMQIWLRFGHVVGLSNSMTGLRQARTLYPECVCADGVKGLPFPDNTFDYIVAADVLGHFVNDDKDFIMREMYRCLKPGGALIAMIETWGKYGELYRQNCPEFFEQWKNLTINRVGHIGLETSQATLDRVERHGFHCQYRSTVGPWPGYVRGFFTPGFERIPLPTRLHRAARAVGRIVRHSWILERITDNVFGVIGSAYLTFGGLDYADGVLVLGRKASAGQGTRRPEHMPEGLAGAGGAA